MIPVGARVVMDCNVLLQAMVSPNGPSGACFRAVVDGAIDAGGFARRDRRTAGGALRASVRAKLRTTEPMVEVMTRAVLALGTHVVEIAEAFALPEDPDDAHDVNLAAAAGAGWIVSRGKHLLGLMEPTSRSGRELRARLPRLEVRTPVEMLERLRA